jgi:signal transduction histidine kinase
MFDKQFQSKTQQWHKSATLNHTHSRTAGLSADTLLTSSYEFSKRIGNEDYLISALTIPGQNQPDNAGMLCVKLNNFYLQDNILNDAIQETGLRPNTIIYISTLSGDSVKGTRNKEPGAITTTALFDNNFPPWRLELANIGSTGPGKKNIFASFYFWTIITLIIILVFGTALIARIVSREMEILKLKSDFVSSVSHEFKTPLTAMKALTERIEKGKVTQPAKMKQYISIISKDIDRLIRLVGNILNFSNIEEGKKVYKKEETDIAIWLKETINNYEQESIESGLNINVELRMTSCYFLL